MLNLLTEAELVGTAPCRDLAEAAIQRGSLSFGLASRLLAPSVRSGVTALYWWCRHCDDVVDGQELGQDRKNLEAGPLPATPSADAIDELWRSTLQAAAGRSDGRSVFAAMGWVLRRFQIPQAYPWELLAGMRMDAEGVVYEDLSDLNLYCFRVAGVVGLMYAHIAGVSDQKALRHAVDLGIAMQLTNIARDIRDDAQRGRVYLPRRWMLEAGVDRSQVMHPNHRDALVKVVGRLLQAAEACYLSGEAGLQYLPWRAALAAAAAGRIYREIGRRVRARGEVAWETRVVVPKSRKLWLVLCAAGVILRSAPARMKSPWRAVSLTGVWRFT